MMLEVNYRELINEVDSLTKQGQRSQSLLLLEKIRKTLPPSEFLLDLARLAHRNSAFLLAMRILYPDIKRQQEGLTQLTPEVLAVYANSLLNIGARDEAEACIAKVGTHHEVLFVRALIDFSQWKYLEAIPKLQDYIKNKNLTPYRVLVGQVNLAASYVSLGRWNEARTLLNSLIESLKSEKETQLLLGNCYELYSQIEIFDRRFEDARKTLQMAFEILSSFHSRYLLYVKKWNGVLDLTNDNKNQMPLLQIRMEALNSRNWETVRDCDFHLARLTHNSTLMKRVYLGTPYKAFRKRLSEIYGVGVPQGNFYDYCPDNSLVDPKEINWDLRNRSALLKSGQTSLRLIQAMTLDIYKPPRMGQIFSSLYPTERFNPFTSPQRVRSTIFRFNEWSKQENNLYQIEINKGDFQFLGPREGGLRVRSIFQLKSKPNLQLQEFRKNYGGKSFATSDVASTLGISVRSSNTLIKYGCERKILRKISSSRSSRYLFNSNRKN
jgi:tetratricopeptide (TPR) repeat protein